MSASIVATVADAEDIDPRDLTPPLYEAIDTGALNDLIATTDCATRVSFSYHGYDVTVRGDGHVSLE